MAQLLVKAQDYVDPDPTRDLSSSYKRGDVAAVLPDGHVFGASEGLPKFQVVDMPGAPEDYYYLCSEDKFSLRESAPRAALRLQKLKRRLSQRERPTKTRRRYRVDLDSFNQIADKRMS